jgi:hypothetical protein
VNEEKGNLSNRFLPEMKKGKYFFWLLFFFLIGAVASLFVSFSPYSQVVIRTITIYLIIPVILFFWAGSIFFFRYCISIKKIALLAIAFLAGGLICQIILSVFIS